jgi:hypothetical protein
MEVFDNDTEGCSVITSFFKDDGELVICYSGDITDKFSLHILDEITKYDGCPHGFTLVMSSDGGDVTQIKPFLTLTASYGMNRIVGMGVIASSGLSICLEAVKRGIPVYIDEITQIVLHRCMSMGNIENRSERISDFTNRWAKRIEEIFDKTNEDILPKLSNKQLKEYKSGHNVYLLGIDLIEFGLFEKLPETLELEFIEEEEEKPKEILNE